MCQTCLESVSTGVRFGRGGRRGQGDRGGGVQGVVHGQDQPRASDGDLVFGQSELVVQAVVMETSPGAGAFAVDGARAGGVRAHCDVCEHRTDAGIVQNEVIVVMELALVLIGLRAGEASGDGAAAGRQRRGERRTTVSQQRLQVIAVEVIPDPEGPGAFMLCVSPLGSIQHCGACIFLIRVHTHRYAHEGQHGHGATTTDPHCEENNQECGGKHHLSRICRCVPNGEGKGHRPTQTCKHHHMLKFGSDLVPSS